MLLIYDDINDIYFGNLECSFTVSVLKFVNYTGPCKINFRAFKLSGS